MSFLKFPIFSEDTRTPEARRVELLKSMNLNCSKCHSYNKREGKCRVKNNKVNSHNICELYGKVILK